ncbi:MAG: 4-hydroxythreonine-4-phosphate dehydrogenase PdxA [Flavobacteriaceae bacterium]|nr:4-hydroxythreonine-4-phosphate dehydrogenase PdxA [Eudoraea sp.]NNJ38264.1 4-hydroxythreonine-4-phosphate dehydrogenase PdxA [Flavobacteriaceae bacterium]
MKDKGKIKLGISIGDLNGIGGEVALRTFEDPRMLEFCTPVIFASNKIISELKNTLKINIQFTGINEPSKSISGKINVVNVWKEAPEIRFGVESKEAGTYAIKSLRAAVNALKKGDIDLLVTAPINKKNIQDEEYGFPGHTDYLAEQLDGQSLMFMVTDTLKVGLLTDHVAVKDVAEKITPELIRTKVLLVENSLRMDFGIRKPRIAVLGINPHSGDDGVIGKEDEKVMKPTLRTLAEEGHMVFGPYAADGFFGSETYKQFDAVLAAYHDQGLIPFKTLSFGKGVNFTAGLSKIRTSPDHGTALDIAGQGTADASSFKEAVHMALRIYKNRIEYQELTANPLKKQKLKR